MVTNDSGAYLTSMYFIFPESTSNSVPNTLFPPMLTDGHTVHRRFVEMKYGPVYIFGAVAGNSSRYATWDIIKIYGGVDNSWYNKSHFRCCLAYSDQGNLTFKKVFPSKTRGFIVSSAIWSVQVTCFNTRHEEKLVPIGAALTVNGYNCSRNHVRYVSPYFPLREATEKVAIGTKTSYGNISAELIIEWMESWRYIGVDKVLTFQCHYCAYINAPYRQYSAFFTAVKLQFSDEKQLL